MLSKQIIEYITGWFAIETEWIHAPNIDVNEAGKGLH